MRPRAAKAVRRTVRVVAAAALATGGFMVATAGSAGAVTPARTAWWNEAPLGVLPLPGQVGADQLAVGQGAGGPTAVAAVLYTLSSTDSSDPGQAGATMILPINSGSSVGTAAVVACPITSGEGWAAGGNQPAGSTPKYSCSPGTEVKGVSPDGNSLVFALTPAQQVAGSPGTFNLALVPDPSSSSPFQTVVNSPSGDDFSVSNPPEAGAQPAPTAPASPDQGTSAVAPPAETAPPVDTPFASEPVASAPPALPAPAAPTPTASAPTRAPAGGVVSAAPAVPASSPGFLTGRRQQLLGVWLMIDAGLALAFFGGSADRMPRLLGSLAARRGEHSPAAGVEMGGIGRFARPRSGPPRRL
ncbi:MAG TPA: hypothetical protein VFA11_15645 [Acidimicrobiales bacterium]|nr:hypothetical protein [Acidimicrobiales bacterium]